MQRALNNRLLILLLMLVISLQKVVCQDTERPLPPVLDLVTVDPLSGFSDLSWTPGGSADVAGYVIYRFVEGEGVAFDTVYNPYISTYTHTVSYANSFSMEYVIAAIDSSNNTSPLSNPLNTVFVESSLDTCRHAIELNWNSYNSSPHEVIEYIINISVNGSAFTELGTAGPSENSFSYSDFKTSMSYCITISTVIEEGLNSMSNQSCIQTDIPRPPAWINGNFASVSGDEISLSFTYDNNSEILDMRIESSLYPAGPFTQISTLYSTPYSFTYIDEGTVNRPIYYRAAAVNNCGEALVYSNLLTAIDLRAEKLDDRVMLRWSEYMRFKGDLDGYRIYRINNGIKNNISVNNEGDTIFFDKLSNFSYISIDDRVCYSVEAVEGDNPHIGSQLASSDSVCLELEPDIYVPNAFTPDGDLVNDEFFPFMTFTPVEFKLVIANRSGVRLYETNSFPGKWDGTSGGEKMRPDVYLWFLRVKSPGGKIIEKNGTVTILNN